MGWLWEYTAVMGVYSGYGSIQRLWEYTAVGTVSYRNMVVKYFLKDKVSCV